MYPSLCFAVHHFWSRNCDIIIFFCEIVKIAQENKRNIWNTLHKFCFVFVLSCFSAFSRYTLETMNREPMFILHVLYIIACICTDLSWTLSCIDYQMVISFVQTNFNLYEYITHCVTTLRWRYDKTLNIILIKMIVVIE